MTLFELIMVALFCTFIVVTVVGIILICRELMKIEHNIYCIGDRTFYIYQEFKKLTNRISEFTGSLKDADFKIKTITDDSKDDEVTVRLKIKDMKDKKGWY